MPSAGNFQGTADTVNGYFCGTKTKLIEFSVTDVLAVSSVSLVEKRRGLPVSTSHVRFIQIQKMKWQSIIFIPESALNNELSTFQRCGGE